MGHPVWIPGGFGLELTIHPHPSCAMAEVVDYWFDEGANAFKAGIPISELMRHFPQREMSPGEWNALEQGWCAQHTKILEQSGQARLF